MMESHIDLIKNTNYDLASIFGNLDKSQFELQSGEVSCFWLAVSWAVMLLEEESNGTGDLIANTDSVTIFLRGTGRKYIF